jgi:hypothetical protein
MCLIVPYYYKKIEDQRNFIMKIKGPFCESSVIEWNC